MIKASSQKLILCPLLCLLLHIDKSYTQVFEEVSESIGINFKHEDGSKGLYGFIEMGGSGLAWLDYNNDNLVDLFLINGANGKNKLYKNDNDKFIDVSDQMNVSNREGFSTGVCSADINQDGWMDLLLTVHGNDILYINQNGKSFKQVQLDKEKKPFQWSTNCSFGDLDNDGDLDLYVGRYALFKNDGNNSCPLGDEKNRGYCNPTHYPGITDGLYFNDGKGHFKEASDRGIDTQLNDRAFGVIISDFDQDNDMDIYVGNDTTNNRLYKNNGKGFFTDMGLVSGTAINIDGKAESSMGIALGDIDKDGLQDIIVSHFSLETNTIYQNFGEFFFSDMTHSYGMTKTGFMPMGWGIEFADINNNSYIDLIVANGHINDFIKEADSRQDYGQHNQVFLNELGKKFIMVEPDKAFSKTTLKSSRGLAIADFNNDGRIDVAINSVNTVIEVFKNTIENKNNWLGLKLIGHKVNMSAIGAVVTINTSDGILRKEVISGGSYMSQSDLRLLFGLNKATGPIDVTIAWPDGIKSHHKITDINKYHTIKYKQ